MQLFPQIEVNPVGLIVIIIGPKGICEFYIFFINKTHNNYQRYPPKTERLKHTRELGYILIYTLIIPTHVLYSYNAILPCNIQCHNTHKYIFVNSQNTKNVR